MVNVKSYSCFPTMVYEFDGGMTKQNHANMLNILDFEKPDNNNAIRIKEWIGKSQLHRGVKTFF